MQLLLSLIFLISLILLIIGLIKPNVFAKYIKNPNRKKLGLIFAIPLIISIVLAKPTPSNPQEQKQNTAQPANNAVSNAPTTTAVAQVVHKTQQQVLEEKINQIVTDKYRTSFDYKSLEVENSDSDRPTGTKMLTITLNVKSFWSKDSLLHETGKVSGEIFQAVYASKLNPYDVLVWFKGETTDKYGNKKDSVIMTYHMEKETFDKVNWQNFDSNGLCDFLRSEGKLLPLGQGTSCTILAQID